MFFEAKSEFSFSASVESLSNWRENIEKKSFSSSKLVCETNEIPEIFFLSNSSRRNLKLAKVDMSVFTFSSLR